MKVYAGKINPFSEINPLTDLSSLWVKHFFLWDWLAVALSDPLFLFVRFRLHGESNIGSCGFAVLSTFTQKRLRKP